MCDKLSVHEKNHNFAPENLLVFGENGGNVENEELRQILSAFGITFEKVTAFYDTSHGEEDKRLNYILDDAYVLKIHAVRSMWEERLQQISRLIERYRSIGVYCPRLIPTLNGTFSCPYALNGVIHTCFVEEYAHYPVCGEGKELDQKEIVYHMGVLAAKYTGVDLSPIYSMWSIIDLSPLDQEYGMDEKQSNALMLMEALKNAGLPELSQQVETFNLRLRDEIQKAFRKLPRCVYQGDLNQTNFLCSDGHFAGLIDFNLSGTDVNINVFVNETNWFASTEDFDRMTVPEILTAMDSKQEEVLAVILENYTLNDLEKQLLPSYKGLCDLFQYPIACKLVQWLEDSSRREKAAALISELVKRG